MSYFHRPTIRPEHRDDDIFSHQVNPRALSSKVVYEADGTQPAADPLAMAPNFDLSDLMVQATPVEEIEDDGFITLRALVQANPDTPSEGMCDDNHVKIGRERVLDAAKGCVLKDRQATYGPLENSFATTAAMWGAYLGHDVKPHDVPALLALLKIARIKTSPAHQDNWVDLAGYAACGGEIAEGLSQ